MILSQSSNDDDPEYRELFHVLDEMGDLNVSDNFIYEMEEAEESRRKEETIENLKIQELQKEKENETLAALATIEREKEENIAVLTKNYDAKIEKLQKGPSNRTRARLTPPCSADEEASRADAQGARGDRGEKEPRV